MHPFLRAAVLRREGPCDQAPPVLTHRGPELVSLLSQSSRGWASSSGDAEGGLARRTLARGPVLPASGRTVWLRAGRSLPQPLTPDARPRFPGQGLLPAACGLSSRRQSTRDNTAGDSSGNWMGSHS